MKTFALASLFAVSMAADMVTVERDFVEYIVNHGKSYQTKEEYEFRLGLFAKASEEIAELNSQNGSATYGHNKFSDMTDAEFSKYLGEVEIESDMIMTVTDRTPKSDHIDWRESGLVPAVRD